MPRQSKIIIDTNLWISFLIGKELQNLKGSILTEQIKLMTTDQLNMELRVVTSREKLRKYFDQDKINDLFSFLEIIAENVKVKKIEKVCRDEKDDFLLALAKESKAEFLITGDKDLLTMKSYGKTEIITAKRFKELFE